MEKKNFKNIIFFLCLIIVLSLSIVFLISKSKGVNTVPVTLSKYWDETPPVDRVQFEITNKAFPNWKKTVTLEGSMNSQKWTGKVADISEKYVDENLVIKEITPNGWESNVQELKITGGTEIQEKYKWVKTNILEENQEYIFADDNGNIIAHDSQNRVIPGKVNINNGDIVNKSNYKADGFIWDTKGTSQGIHVYVKNAFGKNNGYLDIPRMCIFENEDYANIFIITDKGYLVNYEPTEGCYWIFKNENESLDRLRCRDYTGNDENVIKAYKKTVIDESNETPKQVICEITGKKINEDSGNIFGSGINLPISKIVKDKGNGHYDLELTATGISEYREETIPLDVLFVVDTTGSMKDPMGPGNNISRREALFESYESVLSELKKSDSRIAVVNFSGKWTYCYEDSEVNLINNEIWSNDFEKAKEIVKDKLNKAGGSTNYEAAFYTVNSENIMGKARPEAAKVIIFLTDGFPNQFYSNGVTDGNIKYYRDEKGSGFTYSSSYDNPNPKKGISIFDSTNDSEMALVRAKEELKKIKNVDAFFTIGVSTEMAGDSGNGLKLLENLEKSTSAPISQTFIAEDQNKLNEVMETINRRITKKDVTNATVYDQLSENVEPTKDGKIKLQIVRNADGKVVKEKIGNLNDTTIELGNGYQWTAFYNKDKRCIEGKFPDDYKVSNEYEYKISMEIVPSEKAREKYAINYEPQKDIADDDTGTYEGQEGIYTNDEAGSYYSYEYGGKVHHQKYKKPVIKLEKQRKLIVDIDVEDIENRDDFPDQLTLIIKKGDTVNNAIEEKRVTISLDGDNTDEIDHLEEEIDKGKYYDIEVLDIPEGWKLTWAKTTHEGEHGNLKFHLLYSPEPEMDYELPTTGILGGTTWFTVIGSALIFTVLLKNKRRKD